MISGTNSVTKRSSSLAEAYNDIWKNSFNYLEEQDQQQEEQEDKNEQVANPASPVVSNTQPSPQSLNLSQTTQSPLKGLSEEYNKMIQTKLGQDIVPVQDYDLSKSFQITDESDLKRFKMLFPLAPSTRVSEAEDSKGSGKGEIALYWLLSKNFAIDDSRSRNNPDLRVMMGGEQVGLEVKNYTNKTLLKKGFKIGKFKKLTKIRETLSIIFGLKALFGLTKPESKRPAAVDVFNSDELVSSFEEIQNLVIQLDTALHQHGFLSTLPPIAALIKQLTVLEDSLYSNIKPNQPSKPLALLMTNTGKEAAALVLKKLVKQMVTEKPGFGSYFANTNIQGIVNLYKVDEKVIDNAKSEDIIDNVAATSGEIYITDASKLFIKL